MAGNVTRPGVYIEESSSEVRPIVGVGTSSAAFVDCFARGPMNHAVRVASFGDFERRFGGLHAGSEASYALQQFFLNGGATAWVVRVAGGTPLRAGCDLPGGPAAEVTLRAEAADEGLWGNALQVAVVAAPDADRFDLFVREVRREDGQVRAVVADEAHLNLSMSASDPRHAPAVVQDGSALLRLSDQGSGRPPAASARTALGGVPDAAWQDLSGGSDGAPPQPLQVIGDDSDKTGLFALDRIAPEVFNLLCLPAAAAMDGAAMAQVYAAANAFAEPRCAFVLIDVPAGVDSRERMRAHMAAHDGLRHRNAAIYFPRLLIPDALRGGRARNVAASGTLAGICARTDAARGPWKAPAGTEAQLRNADLAVRTTDADSTVLNPAGVNVLRHFASFGNVAWGARTLLGADLLGSEWKYVPVRRTALFIEASLRQGLRWVVFEPNGEPLWSQIRASVAGFLHGLFRQGAFQGATPREAYWVKCDAETTTAADIDRGVVNTLVGFAPLKPAEFVVLQLRLLAGQGTD